MMFYLPGIGGLRSTEWDCGASAERPWNIDYCAEHDSGLLLFVSSLCCFHSLPC
jgi:hypothetical protein